MTCYLLKSPLIFFKDDNKFFLKNTTETEKTNLNEIIYQKLEYLNDLFKKSKKKTFLK